jgi:7,8-dihydro-6-hydroxymethylpterin-pyrophosphokinase
VHTFSSAHKILTEALKIEKKGVFVAKERSRIIDIDLIAFDEEIINSEKSPHPLMQDRKLLLPIQDLNLIGNIPFLKKNISELLEDSQIRAYVK